MTYPNTAYEEQTYVPAEDVQPETTEEPMAEPEHVAPSNPAPEAPAEGKAKKRRVSEPVRDLDTLDKLDPKKMTPQEVSVYIKACREAINQLVNKNVALEKNAESAYAKVRELSESLDRVTNQFNKYRFNTELAIKAAYVSVSNMKGGDI